MSFKVLVFVPAFGGNISATTFLTTHQLREMFLIKGIGSGISTMSFPSIDELRSMYLTIFNDAITDATHLLMIDADIGFPPELVLDMLLFNEPLVGGCYAKRTLPLAWTPSGFGGPTAEVRAGHMKVEGIGMGVTLIRRDCVQKLMEQYPELIDTRIELHPAYAMFKQAGIKRLLRMFQPLDIPERGVLSEDLSFCKRWERCGGTVWANINHRISHVGPYDFAGRYMDEVEKHQAAAVQQAAQPVEAAAQNMLSAMEAVAGKANGPLEAQPAA
jgi:hypothetical protein